MDNGGFGLRWDDDPRVRGGSVVAEETISSIESAQALAYAGIESRSAHLVNFHASPGGFVKMETDPSRDPLPQHDEATIADTDQIAAENLIYLAQDIVSAIGYGEPSQRYASDDFAVEHVEIDTAGEIECTVTEEVITDDWVQPGGQERVEVPLDRLTAATLERENEGNDVDVPLPTDQDEYTAMRPYPCDFCSRRFRKKSNLVNHMVAHQNDRPFGCNLCGARYVRRFDLLNHLKVHAYVPEEGEEEIPPPEEVPKSRKRKKSAQSSNTDRSSYSDKTAVAARTQQYEGPGTVGGRSFASTARSQFQVTDPSRPFVCQHCGVGFAREKALASHARIHGGDSPLECSICGELCWSKENLINHTHAKHPHKTPRAISPYEDEASSGESYVEDEQEAESWIELICKDCGAGFQRADLLQRHVRAAHTYMYAKKDSEIPEAPQQRSEDANMSGENWGLDHACSVCGEGFKDALELLAHAESHARSGNNRCMHCGQKFDDDAAVVAHISVAHPDLPPNSCSFCGRTCQDEKALTKHIMTTHESPRNQLFCSKCGKSFHSKGRLKRHMVSHRDKAVTCNICSESFADGRSLMNHRHSHSSSGGKQFPCYECGKSFGSRSSQQIHIRIHTGERPYGCRFCWKAFADGGTLRKHERIHTGEKPYACAVCPRAFNQRVVLREHVRSHHSGPVSRRGSGTTYWCPVCDRLMPSSTELVHHIIQHCDNNTAMKRLPQRRRKAAEKEQQPTVDPLKLALERNTPEVVERTETTTSKRRTVLRVLKKDKSDKTAPQEESADLLTANSSPNCSADSSTGGSARTKGKLKSKKSEVPTRPKMIHTERAKPGDNDTGSRRKGRSSTTLITTSSAVTEERMRPRTKNVSYHEGSGRLPAATFPSSVKREPENDIAADLRAIQDIDQVSTEEEISPLIISTEIEILKCEPDEDDNDNDSSLNIKTEMDDSSSHNQDGSFSCELCSESFNVREDLLAHVRVHI